MKLSIYYCIVPQTDCVRIIGGIISDNVGGQIQKIKNRSNISLLILLRSCDILIKNLVKIQICKNITTFSRSQKPMIIWSYM